MEDAISPNLGKHTLFPDMHAYKRGHAQKETSGPWKHFGCGDLSQWESWNHILIRRHDFNLIFYLVMIEGVYLENEKSLFIHLFILHQTLPLEKKLRPISPLTLAISFAGLDHRLVKGDAPRYYSLLTTSSPLFPSIALGSHTDVDEVFVSKDPPASEYCECAAMSSECHMQWSVWKREHV